VEADQAKVGHREKEQQSDIAQICEELAIEFIKFPKTKMETARTKQAIYSIDGYHWNEKGHEIIGKEISQRINQMNFL